ncbi:hypothetical protein HDV00_002347 [Rhizophlyctis rosea]|nr:hypothetical protein HDV00_002347 [Rhizophlyctis rosea]
MENSAQTNSQCQILTEQPTSYVLTVRPPSDSSYIANYDYINEERTINLPKRLNDFTRVGWQNPNYSTRIDARTEVANTLQDALLRDAVLKEVLEEDEWDYWRMEFHWENTDDDGRDGGEESPEYTVCDKECGYCGRCDY